MDGLFCKPNRVWHWFRFNRRSGPVWFFYYDGDLSSHTTKTLSLPSGLSRISLSHSIIFLSRSQIDWIKAATSSICETLPSFLPPPPLPPTPPGTPLPAPRCFPSLPTHRASATSYWWILRSSSIAPCQCAYAPVSSDPKAVKQTVSLWWTLISTRQGWIVHRYRSRNPGLHDYPISVLSFSTTTVTPPSTAPTAALSSLILPRRAHVATVSTLWGKNDLALIVGKPFESGFGLRDMHYIRPIVEVANMNFSLSKWS